MLLPGIFGEDLFDDWMTDFPFRGRSSAGLMKTDVRETDGGYELDMDMPGVEKEDVKAELKNGYLTISATKGMNTDEQNKEGKYIRRERYAGAMSRSFYIGENVQQEDIHAKFEDGILKLTVPKEDPKKVEEKKYISIEG